MELHQLRYFVATAEEGSITRAAERMHVSQPALSRQIASLEDELGIRLFDRVKQRIRLTAAGRFFLVRARQILCDLETAAQQVQERFGTAKQTIRLGFLMPFLDDIVSPALKRLKQTHKDIEVSLFELLPQAQLDRLRDGDLDLAILGNLSDEDRSRFHVSRLMRAKMSAVFASDHPLAQRKQISLKDVATESFVSLSDHFFPGRRAFLRSICQSQGFEPKIRKECDTIGLMLSDLATDGGVALLPLHTRKLPHTGCQFVKLKTPVVYAEVVAVTRDEELTKAQSELIQQLQAAAAQISHD